MSPISNSAASVAARPGFATPHVGAWVWLSLAAVLLLTWSMAGRAASDDTSAKPPIKATATVGMIGDIVAEVGSECVDVTTLMGPGIDPHVYQAKAQDVRTFQNSDVIFFSGYSLEGQLGKVLERFGENTPTIAVSPASIGPASLIRTQDVYGIDPHLWMDPGLWAQIVPTLRDRLAALRPDCADRFENNAKAYAKQLAALDGWVRTTIASIPKDQRVLVTAHDAFSYYGRAYAIEVAGIQGISTESQAGIADIRKMAKTVADRQVPAVFVESTINPRTIQAVINAARQRGQPVEIGGELYSDAMGDADSASGNYIGMIYGNTRTITRALGGTVGPLPEALQGWAERWQIDTENAP